MGLVESGVDWAGSAQATHQISGVAAMAQTVTTTSSPIDHAMDRVSTRLDVLEKELASLRNRLTPILRPSEPTPGPTDEGDVRQSQGSLVDRIHNHADDLDAYIEVIQVINARCVL